MGERIALCQWCSAEFDWSADECPSCGWEKSKWAGSGRYGLGR